MRQADIRFYCGPSGCGKSWLTEQETKDCGRVVYYDPMDSYENGIVFYDFAKMKEFWLKHLNRNFRIIYRPLDTLADFEPFAKLVYSCGNLMLVADEIQLYYEVHKTSMAAKTLLQRGRHRDIHFLGCTQRPVSIDKNISAMATQAFIFRTFEPDDIDYLKKRFGHTIPELNEQLTEYQYIRCWNGTQDKEILGGLQ